MEPMALDVLFEGATILTMVDNAPVVTGDVGVREGRIALVGQAPQGVTAKRRISCQGKLLMPGLVNAHAHTSMAVLRGYADDYPLKTWLFEKVFPAEAKLDERAVLAGARLGFAEQLCTGTTSISDMYYHEPAIAQLALEVGMRVSLCNAVVALSPDWSMETDRGVQETLVLAREYDLGHGLDCLSILLPSGRKLYYNAPAVGQNEWGRATIAYTGMDQTSKKWKRIETYGGKLVENCVQAIARDCLAASIDRLEAAGLRVVFHVHDEVVIDAQPWDTEDTMLGQVCEIMGEPIPWAPDLPLKAAGWVGKYFTKD